MTRPVTRPEECGSVPVVVALALTIATLLILVVGDLAAVALARRTATSAAEAAALAAAGSRHPDGRGTPVLAATQIATANGARLVTCDCRSLPVTTSVEVAVSTRLLVGITSVGATARADLTSLPSAADNKQEIAPTTAKLSRGSLVGPWTNQTAPT